MKPRREVEIKLNVENARALRAALRRLGFRRVTPRLIERNLVFDFSDGSLRRAGCVLRLRTAGRTSIVTFKSRHQIRGGHKSREEIETEVENAAEMRRIWEGLGMRVALRYSKRRTMYQRPGDRRQRAVLAYDETPAGDFIELEGPPQWIDQMAKRLGYTAEDYITASYPTLYAERRRRRISRPRPLRAAGPPTGRLGI